MRVARVSMHVLTSTWRLCVWAVASRYTPAAEVYAHVCIKLPKWAELIWRPDSAASPGFFFQGRSGPCGFQPLAIESYAHVGTDLRAFEPSARLDRRDTEEGDGWRAGRTGREGRPAPARAPDRLSVAGMRRRARDPRCCRLRACHRRERGRARRRGRALRRANRTLLRFSHAGRRFRRRRSPRRPTFASSPAWASASTTSTSPPQPRGAPGSPMSPTIASRKSPTTPSL